VNPPDIVVATCVYGTEFVRRHGQNECIPIVARASAGGIEILRELFLVEQLKQLNDPAEEFEKRTREYVTQLERA